MNEYGPAPHGVSWSNEAFQNDCRAVRSIIEALTGYQGARWINDPVGMQAYLEWPAA